MIEAIDGTVQLEVATAASAQADSAASEIQEGLSFLTTGLLAFAGVALFVAFEAMQRWLARGGEV